MDEKLVVLVVEDHPGVRDLLDRTVESWANVNLLTCDSFASAVMWLASAPRLDLLISDVRLPGERTGVDLAQIAIKTFPDLAVVVISGHPLSQATGFNERFTFLRKPFSMQELVGHISRSFADIKLQIREQLAPE